MSDQASPLYATVASLIDRKYAAFRRIISKTPTVSTKGLFRRVTQAEMDSGADVPAVAVPYDLHRLVTPYDIPLNIGIDGDALPEDIEVKDYAVQILGRPIHVNDVIGRIMTVPVGAPAVIDIQYFQYENAGNGWVSIFNATKPQFEDGGTNVMTPGVLSSQTLILPAGTLLKTSVLSAGVSVPGAGILMSLVGRGKLV